MRDRRSATLALSVSTSATKTRRDTARLLIQPLLLIALVCAAPFLQFYLGNMHEGLGFADLGVYWLGLTGAVVAGYSIIVGLAPVRSLRLSALVASGLILLFAQRTVAALLAYHGWSDEGQIGGWLAVMATGLGLVAAFGGRPAIPPREIYTRPSEEDQ